MSDPEAIYIHVNQLGCIDNSEHDWSGEPYERTDERGSVEGGATCAKCGMEFGHYALHTFE